MRGDGGIYIGGTALIQGSFTRKAALSISVHSRSISIPKEFENSIFKQASSNQLCVAWTIALRELERK